MSLKPLKVKTEGDSSSFRASMASAVASLNKFIGATNKSADAAKRLPKETTAAAGGVSLFGKGLTATVAKALVFHAAVQRSATALRGFYKIAEEGARIDAAERYFNNAGKSIDDYRRATKGLISDAELMRKANLADSMGLSEDTFKKLAMVAAAASAKTGQSFDYMFTSINLGTARSSRLLLDNLGIIVSVKEANLNYARGLKKNDKEQKFAALSVEQLSDKLSDEAKKLAFAEEVGRKSNGMLREMAELGETASMKYDRLNAAVKNLADTLRRILGVALSDTVTQLADIANHLSMGIDDAQWSTITWETAQQQAMEIAPWASMMPGVGEAYAFDLMKQSGQDAREAAEKAHFAESRKLDEDFADVGLTWQRALTMTAEELDAFAKQIPNIRKSYDNPAGGPHPWMTSDAVRRRIEDFRRMDKRLDNPLGRRLVNKPGDRPGLGDDTTGTGDAKKIVLGDNDGSSFTDFAEWQKKAGAKALEYAETFAEEDQAARDAFYRRKHEIEEEQRRMRKAEREAIRAQEERAIREYWEERARLDESLAGGIDMAGTALQGDAGGFLVMIATAIGAAFGMPQVGSAIGNLFGPALAALDGIGVLFDGIAKGFNSFIELAFGPLLDTLKPLGPAFEFLLSALGHLVGSVLRPAIPIVSLLISSISGVVDALALFIVILSPFVEIASMVFIAFTTMIEPVYALADLLLSLTGVNIPSFADAMRNMAAHATVFAQRTAQAAVDINNAIVDFVRGLGAWGERTFKTDFGLSDFGDYLELSDLLAPMTEATEDNTDATVENTRAVNNLARELRNLPQGYKAERAVYDAQNKLTGGSGAPTDQGWRDYMRTRA